MLRDHCTWRLEAVLSVEELANKLTEHTWPACQAFEFKGYVFASGSADTPKHFVVIKRERASESHMLLESINFTGWCQEKAIAFIQRATRGEFDVLGFFRISDRQFVAPIEHGVCQHCQKER